MQRQGGRRLLLRRHHAATEGDPVALRAGRGSRGMTLPRNVSGATLQETLLRHVSARTASVRVVQTRGLPVDSCGSSSRSRTVRNYQGCRELGSDTLANTPGVEFCRALLGRLRKPSRRRSFSGKLDPVNSSSRHRGTAYASSSYRDLRPSRTGTSRIAGRFTALGSDCCSTTPNLSTGAGRAFCQIRTWFVLRLERCYADPARASRRMTDVESLPRERVSIASLLRLPPLRTSRHRGRFLDHADRRIRRYIRAASSKLIALLEEQKQAIIHQAVHGPDRRSHREAVPGLQGFACRVAGGGSRNVGRRGSSP